MKNTIVALTCLLLVAGCVVQSPRVQLKNDTLTFTTLVDTLATLREAGKFSTDEIDQIEVFIVIGNKLLDQRIEAMLAKKPPPNVTEKLNVVFIELMKYQLKGENDGK